MTTMKLILTQEVTGLGSSGDTVEVKGGYGRNYLLPRGLAIKATRGAEKQIEGIYAVIDIDAEPAAVAELDRQLNLNESVLRTKLMRPEVH